MRIFKFYRRSHGGTWIKTKEIGWLIQAEFYYSIRNGQDLTEVEREIYL